VVEDRLTAAAAVEARPFLVLELEQVEEMGRLVGRCDRAQEPTFVGENDTGLARAEQLDNAVGEDGHELDDVEVRHEGVGQLDEHPAEALLMVEVEHSDVNCPHPQREGERGPNAVVERGRHERGPLFDRQGEIRFEHRACGAVGGDTRPFTRLNCRSSIAP
jgi:hypothetical protein